MIEYGDYQNGNTISFDDDMIKLWLSEFPDESLFSDMSISNTFGLIEALLFEGDYMPYISRNANKRLVDSKFIQSSSWLSSKLDGYMNYTYESRNIKGEENKIYLNNKDITSVMRKRCDELLILCKKLYEEGKLSNIYGYWKGSKL